MDSFLDNLLEKCAGRSASDRLHQRLIEQRLNQAIASLSPAAGIVAPYVDSIQPEQASAQDGGARPATTQSAKDCVFVRPPLPLRSKSYIAETTRRPRFRREDRSYVTHDCLLPDEEYPNWYPPEGLPSGNTKPTSSSTQSTTRSGTIGSDNGRSVSCAPLLYPVPKLPEMIGYGRFRRSKTATEEWFKENLAKELRAMSPLVSDGFFVRGPHAHPFQTRKESDASTISSTYGRPVISEDGSIIVRGFVSASSSVTTSGTLGNRTQESSWMSDSGNRETANSNAGYDCSCPDTNISNRIPPNSIASSSDYTTEIRRSSTVTTPPQHLGGALPTTTSLGASQQPREANLGVEGNQVVARHLVSELQVEQLSTADRREAATDEEGDSNPEVANGHRGRRVKRNYVGKARLARRLTGSKGGRKIARP